jgi:hypothetical protein
MNAVPPIRPRPRGLPLAHWFLLVAASAVLLFIFRTSERGELERGEITRARALYDGLAVSIIYGPAVAALALALWSWIRRTGQFPDQPGHWLLLAHGCAILPLLYGYMRVKRDPSIAVGTGLLVEGRSVAAAFAIGAALLLAGANQQRRNTAWRNVLAGWGAASLALALMNLRYFRVLEWGGPWPIEPLVWAAAMLLIDFVALSALVWLALWQRSSWREQDAWHHIGVIVSVGAIILKDVPDLLYLFTP